jgi:bacterioferritin
MAINNEQVIDQLNRILECELAGVVRYTHYSMMIFGYSRIPIVAWFRAEATESLAHAQQAGEMVTRLGGHPSLAIGDLLETHAHDIGQILRETLLAEHNALALYVGLLKLVEGQSVALEEYARDLIA